MAFVDRVVDYPNRFTLTDTNNNVTGPYTLTRDEGDVLVAGTLLNAANLNEQTQLDSSVLSDFTSAGMTSSAQNDMSDALKFLLDACTVQTLNGWHYIEFGSTRIAYGSVGQNVANTITSPSYGGYRSDVVNVSIPAGLFSSTPYWAWGTKNNSNSLRLMSVTPSSATNLQILTGSGESTTAYLLVSYLIIGAA